VAAAAAGLCSTCNDNDGVDGDVEGDDDDGVDGDVEDDDDDVGDGAAQQRLGHHAAAA
jgi:hypothetical protein